MHRFCTRVEWSKVPKLHRLKSKSACAAMTSRISDRFNNRAFEVDGSKVEGGFEALVGTCGYPTNRTEGTKIGAPHYSMFL